MLGKKEGRNSLVRQISYITVEIRFDISAMGGWQTVPLYNKHGRCVEGNKWAILKES